jgi:DNA-directed RNA polymerase specialized sigma24 family protein
MAQMADPSGGPEDHAVRADIVRVVRDLMDRLTPERRELLSSLFAEDRPSYADLSRRSGIPIGSIGPTRARTLAQLELVLEKSGLSPRVEVPILPDQRTAPPGGRPG